MGVHRRNLSTVAICACAVILSACVTVSGTSGRQFKNASLSSPLIDLSDWFYPGERPQTIDGIVRSLPPTAVVTLQKDLRALSAGFVRAYPLLREFLSVELGVALPATMPLDLEIERAAAKTAEIRSDRTIYIDLEVLQAFFRTSVVDMTTEIRLPGSAAAIDEDDDAVVQRFLEFKRQLRNTKGRTIIGDLFARDDAWSDQIDMNRAISKATSRYYGVLLFTIAHEMGHYALGHLNESCDADKCMRFAVRELAADRFATAMVSVLLPRQPGLAGLFDDALHLDELRGYQPFFTIGYRLARFGNVSACSCAYPSPDERARLAKIEAESTWNRLYGDGWMDKFLKADVYKVQR